MGYMNRKPNRLPEYDYSLPGYYFITICTKNMIEYLGKVRKKKFIPSVCGVVVDWHWRRIPQQFENVTIEDFQIMPNHLHGILAVNEAEHSEVINSRRQMLIPRAIATFKRNVSRQIRKEINPDFQWQRSYYDHVIRDEQSLEKIREYILSNPENWERDCNRIDDNPFN